MGITALDMPLAYQPVINPAERTISDHTQLFLTISLLLMLSRVPIIFAVGHG